MLSLGMQLAQLGFLRVLAELDDNRLVWWGGRLPYPESERPTAAEIDRIVTRASGKKPKWLVSPMPSAHPFWRSLGRRQPHVGAVEARAHLVDMGREQAERELRYLLQRIWFRAHNDDDVCMISLPQKQMARWRSGTGGNWSHGTICPESIAISAHELAPRMSAWVPALAWEAQDWLGLDCWRMGGDGAAIPLPMQPTPLWALRVLYSQAAEIARRQAQGALVWCRYAYRQSSQHYSEYWWDSYLTPEAIAHAA